MKGSYQSICIINTIYIHAMVCVLLCYHFLTVKQVPGVRAGNSNIYFLVQIITTYRQPGP